MYAAHSSSEEVISFLIKKGAKVNVKDRKGRTALMYGSSEALIRAGADVNAKDKDGYTALIYACRGYYSPMSSPNYASLDPDTVKLLIRAGANVNDVDKYGETALTFAISVYKSAALYNFYWE